MKTKAIKVTKLDAARRQLQTAIELYFADGDPVSIHTLAVAAHQIIHDLNRHRKGRDLLFDALAIKDEYRKEWVSLLKKASSFFKHADRGKTGALRSIDFNPQSSEIFILVSIIGVELFGETSTPAEDSFAWWMYFNNPNLLRDGPQKQLIDSARPDILDWIRGDKGQYFQLCLEAKAQLRRKT